LSFLKPAIRNRLNSKGIRTIGQLASMGQSQLLAIPGIGRGKGGEIERALRLYYENNAAEIELKKGLSSGPEVVEIPALDSDQAKIFALGANGLHEEYEVASVLVVKRHGASCVLNIAGDSYVCSRPFSDFLPLANGGPFALIGRDELVRKASVSHIEEREPGRFVITVRGVPFALFSTERPREWFSDTFFDIAIADGTGRGDDARNTPISPELLGILFGVTCDGRVNRFEAEMLKKWIEENIEKRSESVVAVHDLIERVLSDGVVTDEEESEMLALFRKVQGVSLDSGDNDDSDSEEETSPHSYRRNLEELDRLLGSLGGLWQLDPSVAEDRTEEVEYVVVRHAHDASTSKHKITCILKDRNEKPLCASGEVTVRFVNNDGSCVYEGTEYFDPGDFAYYDSDLGMQVIVSDEDVVMGEYSNGTIRVLVDLDNDVRFDVSLENAAGFPCDVQYLGDRSLQVLLEDGERIGWELFFSLKNSSEERVASRGSVSLKVRNDEGLLLYEDKMDFNRANYSTYSAPLRGDILLCRLVIPIGKISQGLSKTGTLTFRIELPDGTHFPPSELSISRLPTLGEGSILAGARIYQAGMYKVGPDIPPGEYRLFANDNSGYWAVLSSAHASSSAILRNCNFSDVDYVTLENGQFFEVNRASFVLSEHYLSKPAERLSPCSYRVGIDAPPGEYLLEVVGDSDGYFEIREDTCVATRIASNHCFSGRAYVFVERGQYLRLERCKGRLINRV